MKTYAQRLLYHLQDGGRESRNRQLKLQTTSTCNALSTATSNNITGLESVYEMLVARELPYVCLSVTKLLEL